MDGWMFGLVDVRTNVWTQSSRYKTSIKLLGRHMYRQTSRQSGEETNTDRRIDGVCAHARDRDCLCVEYEYMYVCSQVAGTVAMNVIYNFRISNYPAQSAGRRFGIMVALCGLLQRY